MTLNEQALANLKRGLEYNGVSESEALKILGVDSLDDVGSVGDALNTIKEYAEERGSQGGNGRSTQRPSGGQTATTQVTALEPIDESSVERKTLAVWGDKRTLEEMAYRARRFFNWARKLPDGRFGDELAVATIQYARLIGANPASEIHAWWDERNQEFVITPDYTYYVKRAREIEPGLNIIYDRVDPGDHDLVESDDIAVMCSIQTPRQQTLMVKLLDHMPYPEALSKSSTQRIGVVTRKDRKRRLPTGWTWETRAKTRALRNALRAFGATETMEWAEQQLGAAGLPPHVGEVLLDEEMRGQLAAQAYQEEVAGKDVGKSDPDEVLRRGRALLRGEEIEDAEFEEIEKEPAIDDLDQTWEEIVTDIRIASGWRLTDEGWTFPVDQVNAHEDLVKRCGAVVGDAAGGSDMRHNIFDIIFEKTSTKALTGPEAASITNRWQAGIGAFEASDRARLEALSILKANDLFAKAAAEQEEATDDAEAEGE